MSSKTCFVIVGPTAVGKTAVAIQVAEHFKTPIISADSRQCFKELNIGVARPSAAELKAVQHYFINSHSIHDEVNAAVFEKLALKYCEEIFQKSDYAIVTGGTGLYIRAFCEGLDEVPPADSELRNEIVQFYQMNGIEWLKQAVNQEDPEFFAAGEIENPQRLMRALEVKRGTGRSILSFRVREKKAERPFNIVKVGLELPRQLLYSRINARVDEMIEKGLVEEAKNLFPNRSLNALQTVGYSELFEYFDGKCSLEEAILLIKQHTRNYAKRQMTWFKKDDEIRWFAPDAISELIEYCSGAIGK